MGPMFGDRMGQDAIGRPVDGASVIQWDDALVAQRLILGLRHQTESSRLVGGPCQLVCESIRAVVVDVPAPAGRRLPLGDVFAGSLAALGHQGYWAKSPVRAVEAGIKLCGIMLDDLKADGNVLPMAGNCLKHLRLSWPTGKNTEVDRGGEALWVAGLG